MKNRKALLIIDMQKGSFTPKTPRYDTSGVVKRINELSDLCRKRNFPVFHIQHDGTGSGEFEKNAFDWEILDEIEVKPMDIMVDKYANDVFYQSNLQATLLEHGIDELIITGCATDFCVESTVQSALTKDYTIKIVADGHTTGERPNLSAKQVIDHYNWVWQNMIPTKGEIQVLSAEEIVEGCLSFEG
ncbi:cysteine hydrolase family protein [Aureibacter tunicatorum]|uniref:Nicotinamidase-related amidase n=1 Tax=Aureibacter tunicatorum TaxID=866807 RepID=A0AAE4BU43_9BACT|nr:cysteine hydrolase family protein [Aureibacter tunicatorum]MDR6240640.1 nicotinamidase-related amidase [Aureibacter tunicatorum]BDD06499.1 isochorismatase [Aureibacter tunicatorum]